MGPKVVGIRILGILGIPGQNAIWMWPPWKGIEYTIRGKVVASPKSMPWWDLWIWGCPWLILPSKVFPLCINHFVLVLCRFVWVITAFQFFLVPSRSSSTPFYPSKVLQAKEHAPTPYFSIVFSLDSHLNPPRSWEHITNYALMNLLFGLCRSMWVIERLSFFLVPSQSSSTPLYPPPKCCEPRSVPRLLALPLFSFQTFNWVYQGT
jgi:hypothetical protein